MTSSETQAWLRYTHLEKLYGYLPGIPQALPSVFDVSPEAYEGIRRGACGRQRAARR